MASSKIPLLPRASFSSSAASDHHHLTTATPSPPVAPPRRHSVVPSTSGFITGYTSRAYIPIERSVSPPLIPVAKAPFWNRKRVAAVVALWLTAFVGWSWWSTSGDEQVVGSYRWSHRNGSNVDVFKDWNISAPDGSATATFIGEFNVERVDQHLSSGAGTLISLVPLSHARQVSELL